MNCARGSFPAKKTIIWAQDNGMPVIQVVCVHFVKVSYFTLYNYGS